MLRYLLTVVPDVRRVLCVVFCLLFAACCALCVMCCVLLVVSCVLWVVCGLLCVGLAFAVCRVL